MQRLLWLYSLILDRQALLQLLALLVLMPLSAACALSPLLTRLSTCLNSKPPVTWSRVVLQDPHLGCVKLTPFIFNRKKNSLTPKQSVAQRTTSWLKIQSSSFFLLLFCGMFPTFSCCSCLVELSAFFQPIFSPLTLIIPSFVALNMQANTPGVEFLIKTSKFRAKRKFRCMLLTSSIKREVMHFHVVVVHRRQRNIQKSVLQVQSCCCFFMFSSRVKLPIPLGPDGRDRSLSYKLMLKRKSWRETKYM